MTFTTTKLAGDRTLIEGTDRRGTSGSQVVWSHEWDMLLREQEISKAHDVFDAKVEEFFAELTEAADMLHQAHQVQLDPLLYIVESEAVEGQPARAESVRQLDPATVLLRAIATGNDDRLIWVNGQLEVTAAPVAPVTDDEVVSDDVAQGVAAEDPEPTDVEA